MSLLNDALRKKDREKQPQGNITGKPSEHSLRRRNRSKRYWLTGIGVALVLMVGVGTGLVVHSIEASSVLAPDSSPGIHKSHQVVEDTTLRAVGHAAVVAEASAGPTTEMPAGGQKTTPDATQSNRLEAEDIRTEKVHSPVVSEEPATPDQPPEANVQEAPGGSHLDGSGQMASKPAAVQATRNDPEVPRSSEQMSQAERYYRKALSYHRQGRVHRAIALYRRVVQLQPHHFDARFNLVSAYIHTREYAKAHRIASELYRQDGTNQQILSNLAIAKIGMGHSRDAIELLDQVADVPQTSMFTVYLHKGIAYRNLSQMDAALDWYKKAEALKPDHPQLLFNIALAYDRREQYGDAALYYHKYLQLAEIDESLSKKDIRRRISTLRAYVADESSQEQRVK